MESTGRAYGAAKAGEPFNAVEFIKRPKTILRVLSWLFAIIVFGCIVSEGYHMGKCVYNNDANACHYGVAIGILAFIGATVFFVSDLIFPSITSAEKRKKVVIADMAFSALWTFLYFVGFCYLTHAWNSWETKPEDHSFGAGNAKAAIAFSFFSILTWGCLTYFCISDYREGTLSAFAPTYNDPSLEQSSSPYSSFPGDSEIQGSYQDPPFSAKDPAPEYQPPTY
ncbi:synaptogyrin-2-like [Styela clava]